MAAQGDSVRIRLLTGDTRPPRPDGTGCIFGLQDDKNRVYSGTRRPDGRIAFDFTLAVKAGSDPDKPVFTGPFARGPRDERFVYLSWLRLDGKGYVNRIKARLTDIDWPLVREAQARDLPLEADMTGRAPGGGRVPVRWRVGSSD